MKVYIVAYRLISPGNGPKISAFFTESTARSYASICKKFGIYCSLTELNIEETTITETALNFAVAQGATQGDVKSDSSLG